MVSAPGLLPFQPMILFNVPRIFLRSVPLVSRELNHGAIALFNPPLFTLFQKIASNSYYSTALVRLILGYAELIIPLGSQSVINIGL